MLEQLRRYLETSPYKPPTSGLAQNHAAVLIAVTDNPHDPSVILTRRADSLSSHSGEVALPGGKWEEQDPNLEYTALRETHEEIGVAPDLVEVLGVLPPFHTYRGVSVTPFVGVVPEGLVYVPNYAELDAIFHVPLSFFIADQRIRTDRFNRDIGHRWSPAYEYEGYEIWGFTARLLVNFISSALDVDIGPENPAPVKHWNAV
ncbi:MAG: CoA pyrophosphatase [Gammaproteobacteria bacterium]|nr:CoA pyrophosphatase [Gammaproteobacteria bacterium]